MRISRVVLAALAVLFTLPQALAVEGLVVLESAHGAKDTMDRLENAVQAKGMQVFARIDHAAGAAKIGQTLRPTELLIFGNPQGGTPFMQCAQSVGIDLPLKALVWQDDAGRVWLGYNDPAFLAQRHGVAECPVVGNMTKALAGFAGSATGN
jgi:uncharacterized protein (DUF302 family)